MNRSLRLLSSVFLAGLGLGVTVFQDPVDGDDQDELRRDAYTAFTQNQVKALRDGLDGSWRLVAFETADEFVLPDDFRGFAQFHGDGHMSLFFMGAEPADRLFQNSVMYTIFNGIYRYRVSDDLTIQLVAVLGVDNAQGGQFVFHRSGDTREFEAILNEDELTLWEPGGYRFEFLRLRESEFPEDAIERIRRGRTSFYDEEDPNRR